MSIACLLVVATLLLGVVPAPASADVRGEPNVEVYAPEKRFTPGEEATLSLTLLNDATVYEVSERNPGLTDVVTTARGVRVSLDASGTPITVKSGARAVGNLPEGASPPVDFRIVVAEDAPPGRYELDVGVRYTYTRFLGESDDSGREGVRYDEGVWRERTITVIVEPRATVSLQSVQSNVSVGTTGTLTLSLRNDGGAPAEDATVRIASENPAVTVGTADNPATSFVRSWEAGAVQNFSVKARVEPDAVVRPYALSAVVEYDDPDGIRRTTEPVPFGLTPSVEQAFRFDTVTSSLRVGSDGRVSGDVRYTGSAVARNAVLVVESVGSTITPTEREVALGTLSPGEQAGFGFEFDVSDAADAGPRRLSFVVEYRDADGSTLRSDPLDARVEVGPERDVFDVSVERGTVRAGDDGRLTLRVTNAGERPVTDVSAKLFADDPLSATDDEAYLDRLEPGANATLTFGLSAGGGALAKTYPVSLDFQYDDEDGDTLLSDTYRLPVEVRRGGGGGLLPSFGSNSWIALAGVAVVGVTAVVVYRRVR